MYQAYLSNMLLSTSAGKIIQTLQTSVHHLEMFSNENAQGLKDYAALLVSVKTNAALQLYVEGLSRVSSENHIRTNGI